MNKKQIARGAANKEAVRALLASHLGISRVEIAARLGLSPMAVTRHVTSIRAEWGAKSLPTRREHNDFPAIRSPAVGLVASAQEKRS